MTFGGIGALVSATDATGALAAVLFCFFIGYAVGKLFKLLGASAAEWFR